MIATSMVGAVAQIDVIQGEDKTIYLNLLEDSGLPLDITGASAITLSTTGTSATVILPFTTAVTIEDAVNGKIKVIMSDTNTALFKIGEQNVEVNVTLGTDTHIFQELKLFLVKKKLF